MITTYVVLNDTLHALRLRDHHHATLSTAEILTVAVIAARCSRSNHEGALFVLQVTD